MERAAQVSAGRAVLSYEPQTATGRRTHVSAMVAGSLRLVALADVIYFQADQGYVNAVAAETNLLNRRLVEGTGTRIRRPLRTRAP